MIDEWGPWIEHDGKGCQCVGFWVEVKMLDGDVDQALCDEFVWEYQELEEFFQGYIIRYRIRKPLGMKILQQLVENPPNELIKEGV